MPDNLVYGWSYGQYATDLQVTADRWFNRGKVVYCLKYAGLYTPETCPEVVAWLNQHGLMYDHHQSVLYKIKQGHTFTALIQGNLYTPGMALELAPNIHTPYKIRKGFEPVRPSAPSLLSNKPKPKVQKAVQLSFFDM